MQIKLYEKGIKETEQGLRHLPPGGNPRPTPELYDIPLPYPAPLRMTLEGPGR